MKAAFSLDGRAGKQNEDANGVAKSQSFFFLECASDLTLVPC